MDHVASYHIEAQMYQDDEIEFRVFDYGYKHALDTHHSEDRLVFPEPRILQLYDHHGMDDQKKIILDFGTQGSFLYTVPVFKLLDHNLTYLKEKKMSVLAPFMMLSLRDSIKKERTTENTEALRKLILDDIMSQIESSRIEGDITSADAARIQSLVHHMYLHLYSHYSEFQKGGLNAMMNDGLVLDCDIWERDMKKKLTKEITEKITEHSLSNTVQKLYAKLGDAAQVADLLDLTTERVLELL